jgi:hypothetical protein
VVINLIEDYTMAIISPEQEIKLHFERLGQGNKSGLVALKAQNSRWDFIAYCVNAGKNLDDPQTTLNNYLEAKKNGVTGKAQDNQLSPGDMNRKKLSMLFAHLSAVHYEFGDLSIEPIPVGNLIEKLDQINKMGDEDVSEYLNKLIGHKIPAYDDMPLEDFLDNIKDQYDREGVKFHCYLRENFLSDLANDQIKEAEPILGYFMPSVFCQQHITSCEISTTLTMFKKAVSNFKQLQDICLKDRELPASVIAAQEKIKLLEIQFQKYLTDPSSVPQNDVEKLNKYYLEQIEKIQIELELALKDATEPHTEFHLKKHKNHTKASLHLFFTTGVIPKGTSSFFAFLDTVKEFAKNLFSKFQQDILGTNFEKDINKKDIVKYLHKEKLNPNEKNDFVESVKTLFLYGKSKTHSDSVFFGHSLIMDIDDTGNLKLIEHKNGTPEETLLSQDVLNSIGITNKSSSKYGELQTVLQSIDATIKTLIEERNNIVKAKKGVPAVKIVDGQEVKTEIFKKIEEMLEKKDAEIDDLLEIEQNLKVKHGLLKTEDARQITHDSKSALEQLKSTNETLEDSFESLHKIT